MPQDPRSLLPPLAEWPLDQVVELGGRRFLRRSTFAGMLLEQLADGRWVQVPAAQLSPPAPVPAAVAPAAVRRPAASERPLVTSPRALREPAPPPPPAPAPAAGPTAAPAAATTPGAPAAGRDQAPSASSGPAGGTGAEPQPEDGAEGEERRRAPRLRRLRVRPEHWTVGQVLTRSIAWLLILAVLLFAIAGVIAIVKDFVHPPTNEQVTQITHETIRESFPREVASGTAVEFVTFYLTPTADEQQRRAELNAISPPPPGQQWPVAAPPASGSQGVEAVVPAAITVQDADHGVVTVAATLTPSLKTVFVAVPIRIKGNTAPVITADPTFVSPPAPGPASSSGSTWSPNAGLNSQVGSTMKALFSAYAAGDATLLRQLSQNGSTLGGGLGGAVTLQTAGTVETPPNTSCGHACTVHVDVTWETPGQVQYQQTYAVAIVQTDGVWKVRSLSPATGQ